MWEWVQPPICYLFVLVLTVVVVVVVCVSQKREDNVRKKNLPSSISSTLKHIDAFVHRRVRITHSYIVYSTKVLRLHTAY